MSTQGRRSYTTADRALLWANSGGLCAFPDCRVRCIEEANDNDSSAVIGIIAHIVAHSDIGPRANPALPPSQRNMYSNLVILCPTHHRLVDAQDSTYTIEMLQTWKAEQEARYRDFLAQAMPHITFHELETVTQALVNGDPTPLSPIAVMPPQDKMERNGLTRQSSRLFSTGLVQVQQVQNFVETMGSLDRTFVSRLTSGFINEYRQYRQAGLQGDSLFAAMFDFSTQGRTEYSHQSAGLTVLVYLFERCEVFDR